MKTTVLVTGSTDGIGKQTAHELAMAEYQVIVHGKDIDRVEKTVDEIKNASKNNDIEGFASNFESLKDVSILADKIKDKYDKLDILINNAGISTKQQDKTEDGFERTFQVNYLAHFLLTNLLLDLIKKSEKGKIVNVSSMVHATAIDFDNLQGEQRFEGSSAYALSKLCNILFTYKLDRIIEEDNVTVNALHPGVINTKLLRNNWGGIGGSVKEGAENVLYVATYEEIDHVSGKYFVNKMPQSSATITYETEKQDKLWEVSKEMVKDYLA
jgi:NAD(P)-dependent dehydrogenase (short-subunit alcohol dehydrogenase family)